MSEVGHLPIVIRKGRSFRLKFTYSVDDVAVVMTGYTARMMVKTNPVDAKPWPGFDLSTEDGQISIEESTGTVEITVALAVTGALPDQPKAGFYDIVLVPPVGDEITVLEGPVTLLQSVTDL